MEILKKKSIAMPIMSLIILASLILTAKTSIGKALIILLVLLTVFTVIDFIAESKFLKEGQAQTVTIIVGVAAIVGIVIWGTNKGTETFIDIGDNPKQDDMSLTVETDETYELGLFYFEQGNYEESIQTLEGVTSSSSSYIAAQKLLAEAIDHYCSGLIDTANTFVEKDNYKLAIDTLSSGLLVVPQDKTLLFALEGYKSRYRKVILSDATRAYAEEGYQSCMSIIQSAFDCLPNDEKLEKYYDLLLSYSPEKLTDLLMTESNKHFHQREGWPVSDYMENQITFSYMIGNDEWSGYSSGEGWAEFFTDKKYSIFQCSYLTRSIAPKYTFCVYGDGIELYNSDEFDWETGCQNISINIKNVSKLKISVTWSGGPDYGRIFMGNDFLLKDLTDDVFSEIGY